MYLWKMWGSHKISHILFQLKLCWRETTNAGYDPKLSYALEERGFYKEHSWVYRQNHNRKGIVKYCVNVTFAEVDN